MSFFSFLTEEEGSVCLHNTTQAQEETDKWVQHDIVAVLQVSKT